MTRKTWISLMAAVVAVALAVGGYVVFLRESGHLERARAYAEAAATSLSGGTVPVPSDVPDAAAAEEALAATLAGMGSIPHEVTVTQVVLDDPEETGTVTFTHTWTVHADKEPWTYQTTMPITRTEESWRGTWSNAVVAPWLADSERLGATRLSATRGSIIGNDGTPLVIERGVRRIGINRPDTDSVEQAQESARLLAALVDVDAEAFVARVAGSGPEAFVEAIVYRDPSPEWAALFSSALDGIPGAAAVPGTRMLAPTASFAAPILGRVGEATAEIVEKSNGTIRAGDVVGLSGLELSLNDRLGGVAGYTIEAIPASQGQGRTLSRVDPEPGQDVTVSLDLVTQLAAEEALQDIGPASALVALRPSDGHVLAAASGPGSDGYSTATLGQYAPGSTFKTVTTLALLRAGLTPESTMNCTATTVVDGLTFKNYDNYPAARLGEIPLADVFANSCNTGFINARDQLAPESLADAAASLGLAAEPALGIPAAMGSVPVTQGQTDHAASMIGQGRIVSTPLGMATVAASIAGGRAVTPVLVTDPASATPSAAASEGPVGSPVTADEAAQLQALMRKVVTDGTATFLMEIPGDPVMAKTGTAEFGTDSPPKSHAWMIAIQGDLAVAVFVDEGSGGAATAGPILAAFLNRLAEG